MSVWTGLTHQLSRVLLLFCTFGSSMKMRKMFHHTQSPFATVDGNQKSGEKTHLGCFLNPVNNGIHYQPQLVNAGFLNHQQVITKSLKRTPSLQPVESDSSKPVFIPNIQVWLVISIYTYYYIYIYWNGYVHIYIYTYIVFIHLTAVLFLDIRLGRSSKHANGISN